jgi:hypothetical protein
VDDLLDQLERVPRRKAEPDERDVGTLARDHLGDLGDIDLARDHLIQRAARRFLRRMRLERGSSDAQNCGASATGTVPNTVPASLTLGSRAAPIPPPERHAA